jgi:hypothetical protein
MMSRKKKIEGRNLELLFGVPFMVTHQDDCLAICDSTLYNTLLVKENKNIHVENVAYVLQNKQKKQNTIYL